MKVILYMLASAFLFSAVLLLFIGLSKMKKRKAPIVKRIEFVFSALSVILSVIAFFFAIIAQEKQTGNLKGNDNASPSTTSYVDQPASNYYFFGTEIVSIDQMLIKAEALYDSGNYDELFELYASPDLEDNPIVNTNMGFMYANGIFVEKDIELAEQYYQIAIDQHYQPAYSNLLAMYVNNPDECFDFILPLLKESFDEDIDEIIMYMEAYINGSGDVVDCRKGFRFLYDHRTGHMVRHIAHLFAQTDNFFALLSADPLAPR